MLRTVFGKTIWERRRSTIWWLLGVVILVSLTVAVYPSVADQQYDQFFEGIPEEMAALFGVEELADLNTPEGYVNSQIYANTGPIVVLIFTIGMGAAAIAGEEDKRTMDMLLAQPVSRARVVVEKFAAMAVLTVLLAFSILVLLIAFNQPAELDLGFEGMLAANTALALLGLFFGTLTLMLGAISGRRGLTIGLGAGLAVASFFIYGLAPLVDAISWLQNISPFGWFLEPAPLSDGFAWAQTGLLSGCTAAFLGVAVWAFERRDVSV